MIEKKPTIKENCKINMYYYSSARGAFEDLLKALCRGDHVLLLPSYIGISPNEGSGVYDPVCNLGIFHEFYSLNNDLIIDIDYLEKLIQSVVNKKTIVVLLINYFGYVDPNYVKIIEMLNYYNAVIIEDCAHALFSHLVDRVCGYGHYVIYSLHKMLPFRVGGILNVVNDVSRISSKLCPETKDISFLEYDLGNISDIRKRNEAAWRHLLKPLKIKVLGLTNFKIECTPQTFPILLDGYDKRYYIYRKLNDEGFGVVSLYHTLIDQLYRSNYPSAHYISERILNLPIHQDIEEEDIFEMFQCLKKYLI